MMPDSLNRQIGALAEARRQARLHSRAPADPPPRVSQTTEIPKNCRLKDRRAIIAKMKTGIAGRLNWPTRIGEVPYPWL